MGHEFLPYTTLAMMDLLTSDMIDLRVSLWLGIAGLFLALEWMVPFRTPVQSKLHHVSTNLVIFGGNSLVVQLCVGWALLVWSSRVDSETWGLLNQLRLACSTSFIMEPIDSITACRSSGGSTGPTIVIWTWM